MIALLLAGAASATPIVLYDLEGDDGGFFASGDAGQWAWGNVLNGPGGGFDGSRAWSTGRTADYLNAATDYLEIPVPSLAGLERPTLSFQHWYEINPGDYGWVEVDTGNGFAAVEPLYGYPVTTGFTGASSGWRTAVFDLTGYGDSLALRLVFQSDLVGVGAGWTVDQVAFHDGDVAAPKMWGLTPLADTDDLEGPYTVEIFALDDTAVTGVSVYWRTDAGEQSAPMTQIDATTWRGSIPAQAAGTDVAYWVVGTDGANASREPFTEDLGFRVYLPAPTGLTGPTGRIIDTEIDLSWTAPESRNEVIGYEVLRDGDVVAQTGAPSVTVPLAGGGETYTVRGVYAAGVGDLSEPFDVDAVVPTLAGLDPAEGWPADSLRVRLSGAYLLLVDGQVSADLGAGVTVESIEVRDVDSAWLNVSVDEGAAPGMRTLTLASGDIVLSTEAAFEVLDSADRPRLTTIEPESVRQGDTGTFVVGYAGEIDGEPTVSLGEGVVVAGVEVDGGALTIRYAVTGDAALGARTVTVDDGVRVLTGVTFEVEDAVPPPARTCGPPLAPAGALTLLAIAASALRRRR